MYPRIWCHTSILANSHTSIEVLSEELSEFIPNFETLFLGVKEANLAKLTKTDHPFGWLLTVLQKEYASKDDISNALKEAVTHINILNENDSLQWKRAIFYLYLLIMNRRPPEEHDELKTMVQQQIQGPSRREEGEKMAQTMADYLLQQGEKKGEKKGETRAKRESILKLIHLKHDSVSEQVINKIASMRSLSRLDTLFEIVATRTNT